MPSATLNNSDPRSAIGQAGKSHSPASFKIKGQEGIKEKDNTSLKQRLHSAVPISRVPTRFCCRESAGARVLRWCQGTEPLCTPHCPPKDLGHLPWWHHCSQQQGNANSAAGTDQPWLPKLPSGDFLSAQALLQLPEGKTPSGLSCGSRSLPNSSRFSPLPALFPNDSHASPVPAGRAGHTDFQARAARHRKETSEHHGLFLAWALAGELSRHTFFRPLSWVCLIESCYISWALKDPVLLKSHLILTILVQHHKVSYF